MASLPYFGRYRLVDFALSNLVNCGIRTVGMVMPYNYRSIIDHVGSGKDWDLDRKNGGLFILPPAPAPASCCATSCTTRRTSRAPRPTP